MYQACKCVQKYADDGFPCNAIKYSACSVNGISFVLIFTTHLPNPDSRISVIQT